MLKNRGDESEGEEDRESMDLELSFEELRPNANGASSSHHKHETRLPELSNIPNPEEQKRLMLQCILLEAGILFHSVFIGMALSVATGPTFAVFLIAISFHRTFPRCYPNSRRKRD